jgi:hypothetical protein
MERSHRVRNLNFLSGVIPLFLLVLTGCALTKGFTIDRMLMDTQHIFKTSQESAFSMKLTESTIYLDTLDKKVVDTDLSYVTKIYRFINKEDGYLILINMTTVSLAEWGMDTPWTQDLGKEVHGARTFNCGIGTLIQKADGGQNLLFTFKGWMYTPGGIGTPGTTRIVVYYLEHGDQRDNLEAFIARANNHADFTMQ